MSNTAFPRIVRVHEIPPAGKTVELAADESELAALAEQLGIVTVERLDARLFLQPERNGEIMVTGTLDGDVVQSCILTLDPVRQNVSEAFEVTFRPENQGSDNEAKTILLDPVEDEDHEVYRNGQLEIGRIVAEHLALGLDPYPRAPASDFPGHIEDDTSDRVSPFESLKALKDKKN